MIGEACWMKSRRDFLGIIQILCWDFPVRRDMMYLLRDRMCSGDSEKIRENMREEESNGQ